MMAEETKHRGALPSLEPDVPKKPLSSRPRMLSSFSRMYDMDGDGKLDATEQALKDLDVNHDGRLDIQRVYQLLQQQERLHAKVFGMKRVLLVLMIFVVILALSNLGMAFAAAHLTKDTKTDHGALVVKSTGQVVQIDNYVRSVEAHTVRRRRRTQEEEDSSSEDGIVSAQKTTITKSAASDLFEYCGQGNAIIHVEVEEGKQVVTVCPADTYLKIQEGKRYSFTKSGRNLQIACSDIEADEVCFMTGSMLLEPTYQTGFPTYKDVLYADYEDGTTTSGIIDLAGTRVAAPDAVWVSDAGAKSSQHAICHRALLNDTDYQDVTGVAGSESDTLDLFEPRYAPGTEYIYKFSVLLSEWQEGPSTTRDGFAPFDIIWMLRNSNGGPDALIGIWGNSLIIRYGRKSTQAEILPDVWKYSNQWIQMEVSIRWEEAEEGFIIVQLHTPDNPEPIEAFRIENFPTFTHMGRWRGNIGYMRWGLYRPDSTVDNNHNERVVCHDNVKITQVTYS